MNLVRPIILSGGIHLVADVQVETAYGTEDDVKITCGFPQQYFGPDSGVMPISYGSDGGTDCQRAMKAKHITSS